jgi:hypothetical protein
VRARTPPPAYEPRHNNSDSVSPGATAPELIRSQTAIN